MPGILYAIPTPLGGPAAAVLPAPALEKVRGLRHFVVENAKSARAFLKDVGMPVPLPDLVIEEIGGEHAAQLRALRAGTSIGLLSEAGCPAIADPGAGLVDAAQRAGVRVVPLVGPSSVVLALMASGLEGQRFAFCGYLPRESAARERRIRELEARSRREHETQIFIETPYRNDVLLAALLATCAPETRLCVAADLTLPSEDVRTRPVSGWRAAKVTIGRRPAVFLLFSG
jgi:16S rRNA (cytidine1402-2'-O)-methyltransferase